jgi:hypothetical protein
MKYLQLILATAESTATGTEPDMLDVLPSQSQAAIPEAEPELLAQAWDVTGLVTYQQALETDVHRDSRTGVTGPLPQHICSPSRTPDCSGPSLP